MAINLGTVVELHTTASRDVDEALQYKGILYNITTRRFEFWDGSNWVPLASEVLDSTGTLVLNGDSDGNGVGEVQLRINGVTGLTLDNDGNVGIGTTNPVTSALLELNSTTGAFLLSRMTTTQKDALTPIGGMLVYDSTLDEAHIRSGAAWVNIAGGDLSNIVEDLTPQLGGDLDVNGNNITSAAGLNISIGASVGNDFTVDTDKFVVEGDTGFVGINVANPDSRLVVGDTGDTAVRIFGDDFVGLAVESYRTSASDKALINLYSSRGTQASPLALLSGDLMGGVVFRGKKNTTAGVNEFGVSAKIEAVAQENFTDTAQGTKLSFLTTAIGTSAAAERMRITNAGHIIQQELSTDPGTGDLASNFEVAIYNKNNKLVFAYNNGGTITYVSLALDGSATTWVHSTTAP